MPDPTFFALVKEKMLIVYCIEISNGFTKPNWIMFDMFCLKPAGAFVFVWTGLPIKGFCFMIKQFVICFGVCKGIAHQDKNVGI